MFRLIKICRKLKNLFFKFDIDYDDDLCRLIDHAFKGNRNISILNTDIPRMWNMDWRNLSELKKILQKETIINITEFEKLSKEILLKEIEASLIRNY